MVKSVELAVVLLVTANDNNLIDLLDVLDSADPVLG